MTSLENKNKPTETFIKDVSYQSVEFVQIIRICKYKHHTAVLRVFMKTLQGVSAHRKLQKRPDKKRKRSLSVHAAVSWIGQKKTCVNHNYANES